MITPILAAAAPAAGGDKEAFMAQTHWELVARIAVAWGLTFALGFERQIRGAMVGDRTFSLLGAATALIGLLSDHGSTTILAGAVTGIGFIGGGLCFRQTVQEHEVLHGVTTAASIFAASAIGAACGLGLIKEAAAATMVTLLTLELRHVPGLRLLDARRWVGLVHHDDHIAGHLFHRFEIALQESEKAEEQKEAEAPVAESLSADSDAVVLENPVIAQAAASAVAAATATAEPVAPATEPAAASIPEPRNGEEAPALQAAYDDKKDA
jgi:putative Mg2+ transporter-C (MgtC) family protein